jgi:hypothetical protein
MGRSERPGSVHVSLIEREFLRRSAAVSIYIPNFTASLKRNRLNGPVIAK